MNLILCGLPKSGKTTLGKMTANRLQWPFIDTDRMIEEAYALETGFARSCREIFRLDGEPSFRLREQEQIRQLQTLRNHVIATGGGSLSNLESRNIIKSIGYVIYLQTPLETLWERISADGIPSYLDPHDPQGSFYALSETRKSLYQEAAHHTIDTNDLSFEDIVSMISYIYHRATVAQRTTHTKIRIG
jgi:shikimate kinase